MRLQTKNDTVSHYNATVLFNASTEMMVCTKTDDFPMTKA